MEEDSIPLENLGPGLVGGAICAGIFIGVLKLFDLL